MDYQDAVNVVTFSPSRPKCWSVLRHERSESRVKGEVAELLRWNAKLSLPWSVYYRVVAFVVEPGPREALYASGSGSSIQLWRGETKVSTLRGHVSIVRALSFAPGTGDVLASASYDNTIKLWRVRDESWRCTATLRGHAREVLAVSIQPCRREATRLLASGSWDGTVRVWSIEKAERNEAALVQSHRGGCQGAVRSVAFAPDGAALATGCDDAHVRVHAVPERVPDDGEILRDDGDDERTDVLRGHSHWVYCVAYSKPDLLASCSQDKTVRLWLKVREDEFLGAIWTPGPSVSCHQGWVYAVAFSADGALLASGAADNQINVFELDYYEEAARTRRPTLRHIAAFNDHDGRVYSVAFPPRSRPEDPRKGVLLASGSVDGTLALFRISPHNPRSSTRKLL